MTQSYQMRERKEKQPRLLPDDLFIHSDLLAGRLDDGEPLSLLQKVCSSGEACLLHTTSQSIVQPELAGM